MKALMIHKSGPPDVIVVDEVPGPTRTRRGIGPLLTLRVPGTARRGLARLESGKARYPISSTKAGTSRRGSSRNSSLERSVRRFDHFANLGRQCGFRTHVQLVHV
jgi:hypothetical protein